MLIAVIYGVGFALFSFRYRPVSTKRNPSPDLMGKG